MKTKNISQNSKQLYVKQLKLAPPWAATTIKCYLCIIISYIIKHHRGHYPAERLLLVVWVHFVGNTMQIWTFTRNGVFLSRLYFHLRIWVLFFHLCLVLIFSLVKEIIMSDSIWAESAVYHNSRFSSKQKGEENGRICKNMTCFMWLKQQYWGNFLGTVAHQSCPKNCLVYHHPKSFWCK